MLKYYSWSPGVSNLDKHQELKELINKYNKELDGCSYMCCSIIMETWNIGRQNAICYPGCEADLKGGCIQDSPVVVDGNNYIKRTRNCFSICIKIYGSFKRKEK